MSLRKTNNIFSQLLSWFLYKYIKACVHTQQKKKNCRSETVQDKGTNKRREEEDRGAGEEEVHSIPKKYLYKMSLSNPESCTINIQNGIA